MADLDQVLASVTEEDTIIDAVGVYIDDLKVQLAAALAGSMTPEIQAKIDNIFNLNEAQKAKLAAAIVANTPQATASKR